MFKTIENGIFILLCFIFCKIIYDIRIDIIIGKVLKFIFNTIIKNHKIDKNHKTYSILKRHRIRLIRVVLALVLMQVISFLMQSIIMYIAGFVLTIYLLWFLYKNILVDLNKLK